MGRATGPQAPKARGDQLIIQELPDEVLVYDLLRHQAHCLNQSAAQIWRLCDGQRTVAEVAQLLEKETGAPVDEDLVWLALDQLGRRHLLDQRITYPARTERISRRKLVQKLGFSAAVAVAVPLISSINAPTAAQAATCGAVGTPCTTNARCCSGICMNGQCVCLGNCSTCTSDAQCCSGRCGSAQNKCLPCG